MKESGFPDNSKYVIRTWGFLVLKFFQTYPKLLKCEWSCLDRKIVSNPVVKEGIIRIDATIFLFTK